MQDVRQGSEVLEDGSSVKLEKELAKADPADRPELEEPSELLPEDRHGGCGLSSPRMRLRSLRRKGLDIAKHRKRMVKEDLGDQIQERR